MPILAPMSHSISPGSKRVDPADRGRLLVEQSLAAPQSLGARRAELDEMAAGAKLDDIRALPVPKRGGLEMQLIEAPAGKVARPCRAGSRAVQRAPLPCSYSNGH